MIYLIFADLFWSAAAWVVDWMKLSIIPIWAWPFVVVCPIYPLLLSLVWIYLFKKGKVNNFLLSFAALPSVVFGVLSMFYYPLKMYFQGFAWVDLGQIFWVLFYAFQGWYIIMHYKIKATALITVLIFLVAMLVINFKFKTYGYLNFDAFPAFSIYFLFSLGILSSLFAFLLSRRTSKP